MVDVPQPQIDKFHGLAREPGSDEDHDAFKAKLGKIANVPRQPPAKKG
jgi:hypothetical protein